MPRERVNRRDEIQEANGGKKPEQASGSAGSAHQDSKKSYWEHDQWETHYSSGRGSQQPTSPEEQGPRS